MSACLVLLPWSDCFDHLTPSLLKNAHFNESIEACNMGIACGAPTLPCCAVVKEPIAYC